MEIGIYTLPLHSNYGGVLQAYALQCFLHKLGHNAYFIIHHSVGPQRIKISKRYFKYTKKAFKKYVLRKDIRVLQDKLDYDSFHKKISLIEGFAEKHIKTIVYRKHRKLKVDVVIVGSDQVWRPLYARPIEDYFLDFLKTDTSIKKIAYAASFGTENWEFTEEQTAACSLLIKQFDLVSVREDSGIELCRKYLKTEAVHVLDPTMLLERGDYIDLINEENTPKSEGNLFVYILDNDSKKQDFVKRIEKESGLVPFSIMPTEEELEAGSLYPGVTTWLRGFMDAKFVITDSFHGCIFSIIFNKPFIAIGNMERGQARFNSLFRLTQLEERLIDINNLTTDCLKRPVDWVKVNSIIGNMKRVSAALLLESLNNKA